MDSWDNIVIIVLFLGVMLAQTVLAEKRRDSAKQIAADISTSINSLGRNVADTLNATDECRRRVDELTGAVDVLRQTLDDKAQDLSEQIKEKVVR